MGGDDNKVKAYSYLRFSTREQLKGDSQRRQYNAAVEYAKRHGLELGEKLTFHDLGVSAFRGGNKDTGRLGEFKEAAQKGLIPKGSYLLVESLDRISRESARKALRTLEDICDEGITVVTLMDNRKYDSESLDNDPTSLLTSIIYFIRANEESETKAKRLKAAWEKKRSDLQSRPMTAMVPAWLTLDKDTGVIEVIPERAELVNQIFSMYLEGAGAQLIAKHLIDEEVKPWGRAEYWRRSYINKMLENPAVVGTFVPHRIDHEEGKRKRVPLEPVPNYFPQVIDHKTFERVQELRKSKRGSMRGRKVTNELKNIFSGLATCPNCGSSFIWVNKGKWQYLVCSRAKSGAGCEYKSVPYGKLEDAFLREWFDLMQDCPEEGEDRERIAKEIKHKETEVDMLIQSLETLMDSLQRGTLEASDTVNKRIRELESTLATTQDELKELRRNYSAMELTVVDVKASDMMDAMGVTGESKVDLSGIAGRRFNTEQKKKVNAALRGLFSQIVINYGENQLECHWRHSSEVSCVDFGELFPS